MRAAALSIPEAVSTVGNLRIAEPAANVIPGRVSLTLDLRAPAAEALASLADDVSAIAAAAAAEAGCAEVVETTWRLPPAPMPGGFMIISNRFFGGARRWHSATPH